MSCNNSCNNCSCDNTENSYEDSEYIPDYQEFVPDKEYAVGEFFKIGNEVFKVILGNDNKDCKNCEFDIYLEECCGIFKCNKCVRQDNQIVVVILYDTLED